MSLPNDVISRKVSNDIKKSLYLFLDKSKEFSSINNPEIIKCFYIFIVKSYKVKYKKRYSVSLLTKIFKENNFKSDEIRNLIEIYMHGMFILATFNEKDILKGSFFI